MPHKYTRSKMGGGRKIHDLPPSSKAKPLSVRKNSLKKHISTKNNIREHVEEPNCLLDDTPKAFTRLLNVTRLKDNTISPCQKRLSHNVEMKLLYQNSSNPKESQLKIKGGERLSDFGARVDQALPIAELVRKSNKRSKANDKSQGITTENKKTLRYRVRDSKDKAQNVYSKDVRPPSLDLDVEAKGSDTDNLKFPTYLERKRRSRRALNANLEDPWAVLDTRRDKPSGLHDVAQAPPALKSLKKTNTLSGSRGISSRTKSSLRRRADLEQGRKSVIQNYRKIMAEKRGTLPYI